VKYAVMIFGFLAVILLTTVSFAQTEKAPPVSETDEYGIPLKLQSPKKVPAQSAQSKPANSTPANAANFDEVTPTQTAARRGASGRLVQRKSAAKKSKSAAPQVIAPEVLENQATKELSLPPEDLSTGVLPTPATVRSRVEAVKNPVRPLAYRLGVSLQPFTPKGTMNVGQLAPYDMSQAGTNPMLAVEGQWLPLMISSVPGLQVGAFTSIGYAQFNLDLRSPTGASIGDTKLHAIKVQVGGTASYQLPRAPLWSVHGNVGAGRLVDIQSSTTSYANSSSSVNFASLGVAAERSLLPNLSAYAGYDLRLALNRTTEGADVPNHNVLLGLLGNFE
jgi:hypothetical protein